MRTRLSGSAVAVLALSVFVAEIHAGAKGGITINPAPTVGKGSITAQGGYGNMAGWAPQPVQLHTLPMDGGLQQTATALAPPANNAWGPLTVGNLAPGRYAVYALMNLTNGGVTDTVCSAVSVVNVVDQGGAPEVPVGSVLYASGDPTTGQGSVSVSANGVYRITDDSYRASACGLAVIPASGGEVLTSYAKAGPVPAGGNWVQYRSLHSHPNST